MDIVRLLINYGASVNVKDEVSYILPRADFNVCTI